MAIYCTAEQLEAFLGTAELVDLSDRDGQNEINQARVDDALTYADGLINGYVGRRYPLPLSVVPQLLTDIAIDLAHYRLYPQAPLEHVKDAYEAALRQLRDISEGRLALDLGDGESVTPATPIASHGQARSQFDWQGYH